MTFIQFLIRSYSNSTILRSFHKFFMLLFSIFLIFSLNITQLFVKKQIKLFRLYDSRIGHLSFNTDFLIRRIYLNEHKNKIFLGVSSNKPVNKQLLTMIKRKLKIITLPYTIYKFFILKTFSSESVFGKSRFFHNMEFEYSGLRKNDLYVFNKTPSSIFFNRSEEKEGKKMLKQMGLKKDSWFICFHSRDSAYLSNTFNSREWSYHNYRDCDIENYLKAAEYIARQGGYSIRMGAIVAKKLPQKRSKKIIDYATLYRSEFGDIYLSAKCKFFLASSAGIQVVSTMFNVPIAHANCIPITHPSFREEDIILPMKIWSKKKKRLLTFREIITNKRYRSHDGRIYEKEGLTVIQNTPEEILALAEEMNKRIDGIWKPHPEDEKLQKKFKSLFNEYYPSRICAKFLRDNKDLLK